MGLDKRFQRVFLLAGLPGCLAGQAIVEHTAISGGAATAAGSAKSAASAIGGALKKLEKGKSATAPAESGDRIGISIASPPKQPSADPSKSAKTYEDPVEIKPGMSGVELLRRFGEPSMRITGDSGEQTLYYGRMDGRGPIRVRVSGGQVLAADVGGQPAAEVGK